MLVALREEGEVRRDIALAWLTVSVAPMARAVSSVPGLNAVSAFSYGYLKRIPGPDVAMGVKAYQLASSTQAAVASASRGFHFVGELARSVGAAVDAAVEDVGDVTEHGLEVARHATRGAIHGMSDHPGQGRDVSRGAASGRFARWPAGVCLPDTSLREAGYGAVQRAVERGEDPGAPATAALAAARELAAELGVTSAGSCGGAGLRGHRGRHGFRRGSPYPGPRRPAR